MRPSADPAACEPGDMPGSITGTAVNADDPVVRRPPADFAVERRGVESGGPTRRRRPPPLLLDRLDHGRLRSRGVDEACRAPDGPPRTVNLIFVSAPTGVEDGEGTVEVSFCATNLNTVDRLPASLDSVAVLGRALGVAYEIVVADGPSADGARAFLEERARADPTLRVVPHGERNRGFGRQTAFRASRGRTIVPFDTSLVYLPAYAEVLRGYRALKTDRMLFSEICALSRASIEAVGGWRRLIGGEDVDLYARIAHRFGVVAYPTSARDSQSRSIGAYARQMRYVRGSRAARLRRIYAVQRDQIIGANYRVRDLMAFNRRKPFGRRLALRAFFTLAYLGSRGRPLKPFDFGRSNYLLFREAVLDSVVRSDYLTLRADRGPPCLLLTADEIEYLRVFSPSWPTYASADPPIVAVKA